MSASSKSTTSSMSYPSQQRKSAMSVGSGRSSASLAKNNFEIALAATCAKYNTTPRLFVKINYATNFVEIFGDRMEVKDWQATLEALSTDTSISHLRIKNRRHLENLDQNYDTLCSVLGAPKDVSPAGTAYVVHALAAAVRQLLANTSALVYLELDNVPLDERAAAALADGVSANGSLEHLSVARCRTGDRGCRALCRALRDRPNVRSVDVSACSLTGAGASGVTDLVKAQRTRRDEECWAHSLRSRTADPDAMRGLRRITLNGNAGLGDRGLAGLFEALKDDAYVRALDAQDCGLTDRGARLALAALAVNDALVVLDVRGNALVSGPALAAVMSRLYENHAAGTTDVQPWKWTRLRRTAAAHASSASSASRASWRSASWRSAASAAGDASSASSSSSPPPLSSSSPRARR